MNPSKLFDSQALNLQSISCRSYKFSVINFFITTMLSFQVQCSLSEPLDKSPAKESLLTDIKHMEKNNKIISIIGSIKIINNVISTSYFYFCHNGKIIKLKKDLSFTIKDYDHPEMNMLFVSSENIMVNSEENTIVSLKLKSDTSYKFYKLTKKLQKQTVNWTIKETDLDSRENNDEIKIPLNTVIVLIDPNSIDYSLENESWKVGSNVIKLPTIVIKKIKDKDMLDKCCLAFMNIKPFHGEQEKREIFQNNITIRMIV